MKYLLCHELAFISRLSDNRINSRVIEDSISMIYVFTLLLSLAATSCSPDKSDGALESDQGFETVDAGDIATGKITSTGFDQDSNLISLQIAYQDCARRTFVLVPHNKCSLASPAQCSATLNFESGSQGDCEGLYVETVQLEVPDFTADEVSLAISTADDKKMVLIRRN